jgi:hypothetical protein
MDFSQTPQSQEQEISFDFYTGVARAILVGLNPSPREMRNLGIIDEEGEKRLEDKRASGFSYKDEANKKYRLDFWFKLEQEGLSKDTFVKLPIVVWNEPRAISANTQKYQVVNAEHKTAWATQKEIDEQTELTKKDSAEVWFKKPYRRAFVGEESMIKLLKLVTGTKPSEKLPGKIDFNEILSDNYRSIGNIISGSEGKARFFVKLLLGIQVSDEGKVYQTVWRDALHRYAGDGDMQKVQKEVVDYLKNAKGTYFYGFTGEQFNPTEWTFRRVDPAPFKQKATDAAASRAALNGTAPNPDVKVDTEDLLAMSLATQGGGDDDLPF